MGFNTTVVLYNDQTERWPDEIHDAMQSWVRHDLRTGRWRDGGYFGWGHVVAVEHADHSQVCVIGQNTGRYLTPISPPQFPSDLDVLADLLRCHGYSVKHPGDKRARAPHKWGYAATTPTR